MKFKNEIDRWRQIREFAEYVMKYASFHEMGAIHKCEWYEFDNQSAEDYCYCPELITPPLATTGLNGNSREICWRCPHYKVQENSEE